MDHSARTLKPMCCSHGVGLWKGLCSGWEAFVNWLCGSHVRSQLTPFGKMHGAGACLRVAFPGVKERVRLNGFSSGFIQV